MIWFMVYLLMIPAYAALYYILPSATFEMYGHEPELLTMLLYSVSAATPLGGVDIVPMSDEAIWLSASQSVFSVLLVALFVRDRVSVSSDEEAPEDELLEMPLETVDVEHQRKIDRLSSFNKLMNLYIERYLMYVIPVTALRGHDLPDNVNQEFTLDEMQDLFKPTGRVTDHRSTSAVQYYFDHLHALNSKLEDLVQQGYATAWPELEDLSLQFLAVSKKLDFSEHILKQTEASETGNNGAKKAEEIIKSYTGEVRFQQGGAINPYVGLYLLIHESLKFISHYQVMASSIEAGHNGQGG
ncbi:MAG: hypothetical protein HOK42_15895 [Candidatus Marinimicrobia bacterium]|jgi:hypothetical protein|nr:hypothetical protein [Candidatus Neomarinimicrobiota bacterium]